MILTTDDLCPRHTPQLNYWDDLKKEFPQLQLIAFTTYRWKFIKEDPHTILHPGFIKELNLRKDWLTLAIHGRDHTRPSEGLMPYNTQLENLKELCKIFYEDLPDEGFQGQILNAYKPPFYKFNTSSLYAARDAGLDYYFTPGGIQLLKHGIFLRRQDLNLIDTHTNTIEERSKYIPDRIDKIHHTLTQKLSDQYAGYKLLP